MIFIHTQSSTVRLSELYAETDKLFVVLVAHYQELHQPDEPHHEDDVVVVSVLV